jgi:hypothetical protein
MPSDSTGASPGAFPRALLRPGSAPCLSLYQPTHRSHPDNRQDPIRFGNLVRRLEASLGDLPAPRRTALLAPLGELERDAAFWQRTLDGLAVLRNDVTFHVLRLQRPVPELAVVAPSFHLKPLVRIAQSADRYQVLALSREDVRLYEGNRDTLDEVPLAADVPRTLSEALGDQRTEPHVSLSSFRSGPASGAMHHGQGSRKDERDTDSERFFRAVDQAILEHHSKEAQLPLLLAALPEHHAVFRSVSRNRWLAPEGIEGNPAPLSTEALRARAWQVFQPRYLARLTSLSEAFGAARSAGRGSDDLAQVARAAVAGQVATLLVDAGREVPGRLDRVTGGIAFGDLPAPDVDDLLDDVAECVLERGGDVVVVPSDRMPAPTGVAAIYRFEA